MTVHRPLSLLGVALSLALASPDIILAGDLPIYGGLGGQQFRAECPKGSYLVGLAGRTGAWVDRIAPVCAPWLRGSQAFGPPSVGRSFGMSTGGNEYQKRCTDVGRNLAIQSWWIRLLRSDDHYVQSIDMYCDSLPTPFPPTNWGPHLEFGTLSLPIDADQIGTSGPFPPQPPFQACPAGEAATGFRVRAGKFVDAIGLICGPIPARVGASTPRVDPRIMMPRTDLFEIIKPFTGDTIPHGRLVIFAAPPKIGSSDVADIELRYLDAPANQRHSYPFTTVLSVTTVQLLDGYPVPERVTGGYIGRWQVRARSGMKQTPGPWSFPVQFNMIKAPVPPPTVETFRQNAPITQAPTPNSGTAPMMVRPPMTSSGGAAGSFMVRPRGVEAGKEQDPTSSTEKKP